MTSQNESDEKAIMPDVAVTMLNDGEKDDDVLKESKKCTKLRKNWGWIVVAASWIIMIPVAGTLSSFGTIVSSLTEEFNATKLETGWIGSLAFSFTVGTCPLSTPLITVYGGRKVALFGVISGAGSILVTSFIPIVYLMFLTYSAMFGISANFIYNSAMSLTGQYFQTKHQALATCLASAGISFGTLLMNPFSEYLVGLIGWRHTFRILSGMILLVGLICAASFRPVKTMEQKLVTKLKHTKVEERTQMLEKALSSHRELNKQYVTESLQNCNESRISLAAQEIKKNVLDTKMYDCSFCTNPTFILWMLGTLFWSLSFLFPLIFLIDYMSTLGIETSRGTWVMTAYGISEFVGRIICASAAGKLPFGLAYVYAGSSGLMGIATLLAPQGETIEIMFVYGVVIGINSGILNSLMYAATMQIFGNERGRHVWGYINVMLALGMVVGPVTAGGIYDVTNSYTAAFYLGGGMFVVSAITNLILPISQRYFPLKEREAKGKRDVEIPEEAKNRIVKPRSSLRSALLSRQINRQMSKEKKPWNRGVAVELEELAELHEAYEDGVDKNDNDVKFSEKDESLLPPPSP
ncbi:monocarboxylate transporter 5-like [Styela clava]